ncbi:MAG: DUF6569 family protein [Pseudomonadota bacterium]
MEPIISEQFEKIKFGEIQIHKHVAVIPMISTNGSGPDYLTMKEAMENHILTVSEVTEGGQVPQLRVINQGDKPVLLLDGEELSGAKQNRVLNTTILLRERSETIIPVSCTEQGRWSYRSSHFEESGYIMSAHARGVKNESVSRSVKNKRGYDSDQGAVWEQIHAQSVAAKVHSPTVAMRDIHEAKKEDLDAYLEHFTLVPEQKGLLVMINGEVAGLDVLSNLSAFRILSPKLINSYVMDAILYAPVKGKEPSRERAALFLQNILQCEEHKYDSVGYGSDYRYEGKKIVGSALVHDQTVIHMAFFQITETEKAGHMSPVSRRRAYRANQ